VTGLVRAADGSLRFADGAVTPRLRAYLEGVASRERQNAEYEARLFAQNMLLLDEPEPTEMREARHLVRGERLE
jgi:hypothetical protein